MRKGWTTINKIQDNEGEEIGPTEEPARNYTLNEEECLKIINAPTTEIKKVPDVFRSYMLSEKKTKGIG